MKKLLIPLLFISSIAYGQRSIIIKSIASECVITKSVGISIQLPMICKPNKGSDGWVNICSYPPHPSDDEIRSMCGDMSTYDFDLFVCKWNNQKHNANEVIEFLIGDKNTTFKELRTILT